MTTQDLLHIIRKGEDEHLEAKSGKGGFPDSLWDTNRTYPLLPTNDQEPDAEALRKFYDNVEFQDESDKPDDKQALILNLTSHSYAKTKELSELLDISITQVKFYFKLLLNSGKIVALGANKNRTYSLKEETII